MTFWQRVFGFANIKLPDEPAGDYRTGGTLVRVFGWIQAVSSVLGLLFMLIAIPIMMAIGMFIDSSEGGEAAGIIMAFVAVALIFGVLLGIAFALGWLYWIGFILEQWAAKDGRALTHARIFAIVQLSLMAVGVVFMVFGVVVNTASGAYDGMPFGPGFNFIGLANPLTLAQLGLLIWLLVLVGKPEVQEAFETA